MSKLARLLSLICTLVVVAALPARASEATAEPSSERDSFDRVNAARAQEGLDALRWSDSLARVARDHSEAMAADGRLYHDPATRSRVGSVARYGENVGRGSTSGSIHVAFTRSDAHHGNMIGDFDELGVGAVRADDTLWLTQVFVKRSSGGESSGSTATSSSTASSRARATESDARDEPRRRSYVRPRRRSVRAAAPAATRLPRRVVREEPIRAPHAEAMLDRMAAMLGEDGVASAPPTPPIHRRPYL